jgi:tRNA 2-selenouridine synthase
VTPVVDSADARSLPASRAFAAGAVHDLPARRLVTLSGPAGSGKTDVLKALAERGAQAIDLEALACHRGSAFGGLDRRPQPSHDTFQRTVLAAWRAARPDWPLFIEDEGDYLGSVGVPASVLARLRAADRVVVETARAHRLSRLLRDYGGVPTHALAGAVRRAAPRLGSGAASAALDALARGDREAVVDALLPFYDRAYTHRTAADRPPTSCLICVDGADVPRAAAAILAVVAAAPAVAV